MNTRLSKWVLVLLVVLMTASVGLRPVRAFLDPLTIGGLLGLGSSVMGSLDNVASTLGSEARSTISTFNDETQELLAVVEQAYADNLNLTINQLDAFTSSKLLEVQHMLERVDELLAQNIERIEASLITLLDESTARVDEMGGQLEERLQNLLVVGGETAVFVVDRTLFNVVTVVAIILLGVGALLFIWLFFSGRLPSGALRVVTFLLMAAYLIVFSGLAFVPQARAMAMDAAGVGIADRLARIRDVAPEIYRIEPRIIVPGSTTSVTLRGRGLRPGTVDPQVMIRDRVVTVSAATANEVVVNVTGLDLSNGEHPIILSLDNVERARAVVTVQRPAPVLTPADLVITDYRLNPTSPVRTRITQASVTIANVGQTDARNFKIRWLPCSGCVTTSTTTDVARLQAGATQTFNFSFAYPTAERVDTVLTVDPDNVVSESREDNNIRTAAATVQSRRARVTVNFSRAVIINDANGFGGTNLRITVNVNGQIQEVTLGNINDDQRNNDAIDQDRPLSTLSFTREMNETDILNIAVTSWRWHGTYNGTGGTWSISRTANNPTAPNWGAVTQTNTPEIVSDIRWYLVYSIQTEWLN